MRWLNDLRCNAFQSGLDPSLERRDERVVGLSRV